MSKLTGLDRGNGCQNLGGGGLNAAEFVGGKFQDGDAPAREVLLIADVLVGGDEQVELGFGQAQQVAVLDAAPASLLGRRSFMAGEQLVHRPGDALVQKDSHAAAGESSARSERSRMRQAISRVTLGKHSRNSSSA